MLRRSLAMKHTLCSSLDRDFAAEERVSLHNIDERTARGASLHRIDERSARDLREICEKVDLSASTSDYKSSVR